MATQIPFLFCRYVAQIEDEVLDAAGTLAALNELQGKFLPSGPKAERENNPTIVVMRPRRLTIGDEEVVTWDIGHRSGHRVVADYDAEKQEISHVVQDDRHIMHTTIVALPRLGAMAVNDRINALNMGARPALSRTRAAFRQVENGSFAYWFLNPGDVAGIVNELDLLEYSYTARRINPTPPTVLAKAFDASMEQEGIALQRGVARPEPGQSMHAAGGVIEATSDLVGAGYAVAGFKGTTPTGHLAQIRKPPFSMDKNENLKQLEREQPLRIFIETEEEDDALIAGIVAELVRFYDQHDPSDIPEEPA